MTKTIEIVDGLGKPKVFVLNGATPGDKLTADATAVLSEAGTVSPVHIHNDPEFADSMFGGLTVMEAAPDGGPAKEIVELWAYLADVLDEAATSERPGPFSVAR